MKIIAHRGSSGTAPENTLVAIQRAIESGADFVEIDVRLTKDLQLVVLHDASLKRTTGTKKTVHGMTLEEIKQLDAGKWFSRAFTGEKIPTLKEVFQMIGTKIGLMIEIKQGVHPPKMAVQAVFNEILQLKELPPLVIGGFSDATTKGVQKQLKKHDHLSSIKTIGIAERFSRVEIFIRQDVDILALWHPLLRLPPLFTFGMAEQLPLWRERDGKEIWSWTVNSKEVATALENQGVSGIITNYPASMNLSH